MIYYFIRRILKNIFRNKEPNAPSIKNWYHYKRMILRVYKKYHEPNIDGAYERKMNIESCKTMNVFKSLILL